MEKSGLWSRRDTGSFKFVDVNILSWWMDKLNLLYSYNGRLLGHEKDCNYMNEPQKFYTSHRSLPIISLYLYKMSR